MGAIARRLKRRRARALLLPPTGVETRYVALLSSGFRAIHKAVLAWLQPKLGEFAHGQPKREDAVRSYTHDLEDLIAELAKQLERKLLPDFDSMATKVAKNNARAMVELGIDLRTEVPGLADVVAHARAANLQLITNAARDYRAGIDRVLTATDTWGLTTEELGARLADRGGVAESRAELIARDQTLKLNGSVNQWRQRAAGIDEYTWSGSLDERERQTHRDNEGKRFAWTQPPSETGNPSEDVNCRCVAIPIIPELEEPETPKGTQAAFSFGTTAAPLAEPAPKTPPTMLKDGIHADTISINRGADRELATAAMQGLPRGALDALANSKVDELVFRSAKLGARNPPGQWMGRILNGSIVQTEIRINTQVETLAQLKRNPEFTVSGRLAIRAAASTAGDASEAARLAKIRGTLVHEIGHQVHRPGDDAAIERVVRETFRDAKLDGSARRISVYATSSKDEYFAEAFAAYHNAPELLDAKARGMVEKVMAMRKTTK